MESQDQEIRFGALAGVVVAVLVALVVAFAIAVGRSEGPAVPVEVPAVPLEIGLGEVSIVFTDGQLVLDGRVSDEATRRRLLSNAQLVFGTETVIDRINVVVDAPQLWWKARPLDVFARLRALPAFTLVLDKGNAASLTGRVGSEAARKGIAAWLSANLVDGLQLKQALQIDAELAAGVSQDSAVLFSERIDFASGSAEIPELARPRLNLIARVLAEDGRSLMLRGHTDNVGNAEGNRALSLQRADSVASYLVARGAAAGKLATAGFGADKPLADNGTPEGRQRNRRIEFVEQTPGG